MVLMITVYSCSGGGALHSGLNESGVGGAVVEIAGPSAAADSFFRISSSRYPVFDHPPRYSSGVTASVPTESPGDRVMLFFARSLRKHLHSWDRIIP